MSEQLVISARGITKSFGDIDAVRGIDFDVAKGECVGLLGPNGAGKTTTMRMLMGLSTLGGGSLNVFGVDVAQLARNDIEIGRAHV